MRGFPLKGLGNIAHEMSENCAKVVTSMLDVQLKIKPTIINDTSWEKLM